MTTFRVDSSTDPSQLVPQRFVEVTEPTAATLRIEVLGFIPLISLIELSGRALPYHKIEFGWEQRVTTEWYPGSPEATQQVIGYTLPPTTLEGMWKDRFIASGTSASFDNNGGSASGYIGNPPAKLNGQAIGNVSNLVDAFAIVCKTGQELAVRWGAQYRRGVLKKFSPTWDNLHDVAWTMEFEWSADTPTPPPALVAQSPDFINSGAAVILKGQQCSLAISLPTSRDPYLSALLAEVQASFTLFERLQNALNALQHYLTIANNAVSAVNSAISTALQPVQALVGFVQNLNLLVVSCFNTIGNLEDKVEEVVSDTVDSVLVYGYAKNFVAQQKEAIRQLAYQSGEVSAQALISITPDVALVYQAKPGDDLRKVATIYYGSPNGWQQIAQFNRLTTSTLVPGQTILIPPGTRASGGVQ